MKKFMTFVALGLVAASAACGGSGKDTTQPPDTTVTPPPPPPPPPDTDTTVTPPPPPPASATVYAAGNIGKCPVNGYAAETAALIDSSATAVFVLGNAASGTGGGTAANYACGFDPFWGQFRSKWYATMGNLDVIGDTTGGARPAPDFYTYFGDRAGPVNKGWYSFDLNGWHIVVLNTEGGTATYNSGSEQQAWLAQDLAASTAQCKLAFFHRQFVYTGSAGPSMNSNLGSIWAKLIAGGVDLVLVGGQYSYERMNPVNSAGAPDPNGIPQFNMGMGGGVQNTGTISPNHHPASAIVANARGVLRLTLNATSADYKYLSVNPADVNDAGTVTCR